MQKLATSVPTQKKNSRLALWAVRLVCLCSAVVLLTLSAKAKVPFYPVPMTLQTLALMTIGIFLPARMAYASLALYVVLGALGFPVFAGTPERGVGLVYLIGPTAGYILGFFPALYLFSRVKASRTLIGNALLLLVGLAAIYACGLLWLGISIDRWGSSLLAIGFLPFIGADLLKVTIAWVALVAARGSGLYKSLKSL